MGFARARGYGRRMLRGALMIMLLGGLAVTLALSARQGSAVLGSAGGPDGAPAGIAPRAADTADTQRLSELEAIARVELTGDPQISARELRASLAAAAPNARVGEPLARGGSSVWMSAGRALLCSGRGPVLCVALRPARGARSQALAPTLGAARLAALRGV